MVPDSSTTSASMVGLPRESRISRAMTSTIALMVLPGWSLQSSRHFVIANEPVGDLTLERDHVLMLGIRTVSIEIGARRERHVDTEIIGDRAIGRIPSVFETHDPAAVLRERLEAGFPSRDPRVVARHARLQLDQDEMDEHRL